MPEPTQFTMNADVHTFIQDTVDVGANSDTPGLVMEIYFDPNIKAGDWLKVEGSPPWLLKPQRITGYIRSDGIMYDALTGGNEGVRLLANSAELNLDPETPLTYKVSGSRVTLANGRKWTFTAFNVPLPSVDTTIELGNLTPVPGTTVVGVPNLGNSDLLEDVTAFGKAVIRAADVDVAALRSSHYYRSVRNVPASNGVDDTAVVQAIFAENPGIVVFRKGGTWIIDANPTTGMLEPLSNTLIIIEDGATIRVKTNALDLYYLFNLDNVDNVEITGGGSILGDVDTHTGSTGQYGHLINITNGSTNCRVTGSLYIAKAWGDGIYVGSVAQCENILIDGVTIEDCRREGISPFWVDGMRIHKVRILNIGATELNPGGPGSGIDCEPNAGQAVNNLTIENCYIANCPGNGIYASPLTGPITNLTIRDNVVVGCGHAPEISGHSNGIYVRDVDDPILIDNIVADSGFTGDTTGLSAGIRLNLCDRPVVQGGRVSGSTGSGILVTGGTAPEITGVTSRNNDFRGINTGAPGAIIVGNRVFDNDQAGGSGEHHVSVSGDGCMVTNNVFRGSNGSSWVRVSSGNDNVVAFNTGLGTAPTNKFSDAGSNTRRGFNFRVATGVYEAWDTAGGVPLGTIELGHATDTTIARLGAGRIGVETAEVITSTAIAAISAKTTPVDTDLLALFDSADSNAPKSLSIANLKALIYAYIVDGSPAALDTLNELAAALGDDANFATTVTNALAAKAPLVFAALAELQFTGSGANVARLYNTTSDRMTIRNSGSNGTAVVNAANNAELFKVWDSGIITHTGKITPRVTSAVSASSLTPTGDTTDQYVYTALAANLTINQPTGTPVVGQRIRYRIKDDGTSRTLTWNAIFRAIGVTIPTATTISKTMYIDTIYNSTDTKWDVVDVKIEA